jgi:SAM-dependent methyltransferase
MRSCATLRKIALFVSLTVLGCGNEVTPGPTARAPDVGWAPTPVWTAEQGLAWIGVGPGDVFYELGCGDGRVAIVAAKRGARVVCVEIDPTLAAAASAAVKAAGVDDRVEVLREDLFKVDVSPATVVFIFLLPALNARLRPIFESTLRPGTKVLSREFEIEGWAPGRQLELPGFLFLSWIVPGKKLD